MVAACDYTLAVATERLFDLYLHDSVLSSSQVSVRLFGAWSRTLGHGEELLTISTSLSFRTFVQTANTLLVNADLIKKLQDAGSKDDIKVPLRVLRDEIGKVYFGRYGCPWSNGSAVLCFGASSFMFPDSRWPALQCKEAHFQDRNLVQGEALKTLVPALNIL